MAKTEFVVEHNEVKYKCYLENGEVWFYDEKGHPTSAVHHRKITKIEEAKAVALEIIKGTGR